MSNIISGKKYTKYQPPQNLTNSVAGLTFLKKFGLFSLGIGLATITGICSVVIAYFLSLQLLISPDKKSILLGSSALLIMFTWSLLIYNFTWTRQIQITCGIAVILSIIVGLISDEDKILWLITTPFFSLGMNLIFFIETSCQSVLFLLFLTIFKKPKYQSLLIGGVTCLSLGISAFSPLFLGGNFDHQNSSHLFIKIISGVISGLITIIISFSITRLARQNMPKFLGFKNWAIAISVT